VKEASHGGGRTTEKSQSLHRKKRIKVDTRENTVNIGGTKASGSGKAEEKNGKRK